VTVEKVLDELWLGVKGQSNQEIAGSPRNAFRCSVAWDRAGGRALEGLGGREPYQTLPNSEYRNEHYRRQPMGAKVRGREGNSPDRRLRSQNNG